MKQVDWCIQRAQEALKDYDAPTATEYLKMARIWTGNVLRANVAEERREHNEQEEKRKQASEAGIVS